MGFFGRLHEHVRDRARDDLCAALQSLGVGAQMAKRGRVEESIVCWDRPLGVIDIAEGPIRWVNVRIEMNYSGQTRYFADYGVPDTKVTSIHDGLQIRMVGVRSFPLVGRVVGLRWKGNDLGSGLIDRLNEDIPIEGPLIWGGNLRIHAHSKHKCWIMQTEAVSSVFLPSAELWNCYQAIARHLLAAGSPK